MRESMVSRLLKQAGGVDVHVGKDKALSLQYLSSDDRKMSHCA